MECQVCKCTMDVVKAETIERDGKQVYVQHFSCRNKQCDMCGKDGGTREIELQ